MLREVVPLPEQQEADRRQRLRHAWGMLRWVDPELAEWTVGPATAEGQYVTASLLLTDAIAPLPQLARLLRRTADQLDRLARNQRPCFSESAP